MIRKAQPKEGLETGGLISGSEAARARIAAEYEPDLSGANGPTARFDTLRELITTEIGAAQNEMTFASGDGSQIFGRDGKFVVNQPTAKRGKGFSNDLAGKGTVRIWDLTVVDAAAGTVKLAVPGKVRITDDVDDTGLISIGSIGSTFTITAGKYIVLEWDATGASPVCTLKALSTWSGFPFPYTTANSGGHKIFQKGYTPLWVGKAAGDVVVFYPGLHLSLNEDVTLERLAPDAHFELINYLVEIPTGQMVDVDRLIAGCGGG